MDVLRLYALALALAFTVESGVEFIFGQAVDHFKIVAPFRWSLMYVALAAGIVLCFHYQLDLFALLREAPPDQFGFVLTGSLVGRGANAVHDFISGYLINKKFGE